MFTVKKYCRNLHGGGVEEGGGGGGNDGGGFGDSDEDSGSSDGSGDGGGCGGVDDCNISGGINSGGCSSDEFVDIAVLIKKIGTNETTRKKIALRVQP